MAGRPLKFKSIKELEAKIQKYFDSCDAHYEERLHKRPKLDPKTKRHVIENGKYLYDDVIETVMVPAKCPTISGLAVALDTSRQTLLEYEGQVEGREKNQSYADTIKKAKQFIEACTEELLVSGAAPAAGVIFNLKNNYGWRDKQEVEHSGGEDPVQFLLQKYGLLEDEKNAGKGDESVQGSRKSPTQP